MINGSTAFNNAVDAGGYPYIARIKYNNTVVDCNIVSCSIIKGATGTEEFSVGTGFVPYIELEVSDLSINLENKEITLEVGVYITSTSIDWITIGYFTVTKAPASAIRTTITAVGRISAVLSGIIPSTPTTITASSLISTIQTAVRSAGYSNFSVITTGVTLPQDTLDINLSGLSCYDILRELAKIVGCYITENNAGNVVLFNYDTTTVISYTGDRMITHPVFNNYDFELSGIKVIYEAEYETEDGDVVHEKFFTTDPPVTLTVQNSYITTESLFNAFCDNCVGLSYRPANITLDYGDPRLEPFDVLKITDVNGDDYIVPCMYLTHTITGGLVTNVVAPGRSESEEGSTTAGPLTQQLEKMSAQLLSVNEAVINRLKVTDLTAQRISAIVVDAINLTSNTIDAKNINVTQLTATQAFINALNAGLIDAGVITVDDLTAGTVSADIITAINLAVDTIDASRVNISQLVANQAFLNAITAHVATLGYAEIDFANVDVSTITTAWIQDLFVQGGFVANDGTVFHLTGVHISGDLIDANTIKADALLLQGQNGLYYKINVDELGQTTADSDPKYQTGIDGKAIIAHSITATEITTQNIQGTGGWINFASGTFAYTNATSGHGIVWDGNQLTISTDRVTLGELDLSDAIDSALNAADVAMSTLIYDHTYEYVRDSNNKPISANFTAFLYRGGVDVKNELDDEGYPKYPASSFTWYIKEEEHIETFIGTGYTCSVNLSDCGYGAEIIGKFTLIDDADALSTEGDNLTDINDNNLSVRATGDSVRVRDLSTSTTIFPTDKLMVVGGEDEHLVTVQTLQNYLNANLDKQVLFNTTAGWNSQTTLVSELNTLYVYTDHQTDSQGNSVAGIKAGDGNAYVVDLPFTDAIATEHIADTTMHITNAERTAWNNKVRCYYAGTENLIFTTA